MSYPDAPISWHGVFTLLDQIVQRGEMPGPVASFIVDRGVASIQRNFRAGGRVGSQTGAWKALSERTKGTRRTGKKSTRRGHKTLVDTGRLMNSFSQTSADSNTGIRLGRNESVVRVGTKVEYAAQHQEGRPAKNLPARPFAMWQPRDIELIQKGLADYLIGENRSA